MRLLDRFKKKPIAPAVNFTYSYSEDITPEPAGPVQASDQYSGFQNEYYLGNHDGEKYEGGLGPIPLLITDYYALRARSSAFFKTNLYARGLIRRLVTNIVNTGISLEAAPVAQNLTQSEDSLAAWSQNVENAFDAWGDLSQVCDHSEQYTFSELQRVLYREALIEGDQLVIEHYNVNTRLPCYEMVNSGCIETPIDEQEKIPKNHTIEYGVQLDERRRHVAYFVRQNDLTYKKIPAVGRKGRRMAWLYYATDKRHDDVRGEPLLSLIMQSVAEIDQYRDSAQRKASINALFAMFMYQSGDAKVQGTRPLTSGAKRRTVGEKSTADGTTYKSNFAEHGKGTTFDELPPGMEPKAFTAAGTDEKFGDFENSILRGICWAIEIPPSIAQMIFGNSYSASRGEVKEFELVIQTIRSRIADQILRPVYRSWLIAMALNRRITAPGLLPASRDRADFITLAAWTNSNWIGAVKEAVDLPKEVTGHKMLCDAGYSTHSASARKLTGTRFDTNIVRIAKENQMIADAMRPILELKQQYGEELVENARANHNAQLYAIGDIDK